MPYYLIILIQVALVIHVLKTGRNRYWIWLLIFVPLIGGVAYLVMEILPGLTGGVSGQRAMRKARTAIDPGRDLRARAADFERSANADTARGYAEALLSRGQPGEAEAVVDQVRRGLFRTEPHLLLLKARCRMAQDDPEATVALVDEMLEENPDFKSAEGHLLYARALEASGKRQRSIEEYRALSDYFPGAEARYRLGVALAAAGETGQARDTFQSMLDDARLAPAHFRKAQKAWLKKAEERLRAIGEAPETP